MGQQQLILLVLATVIVGLAIVVGIAAFTQGGDRANADAMIQDAVTIASDIQSTIRKPAPFGGVDGFDNVSFAVLGYPVTYGDGDEDSGVFVNGNGQFSLTTAEGGVVIDGLFTSNPEEDGDDGILAPADADQHIQVLVCGMTDGDITGQTIKIGDQDTGTAVATGC